jgi:hypothetical protein
LRHLAKALTETDYFSQTEDVKRFLISSGGTRELPFDLFGEMMVGDMVKITSPVKELIIPEYFEMSGGRFQGVFISEFLNNFNGDYIVTLRITEKIMEISTTGPYNGFYMKCLIGTLKENNIDESEFGNMGTYHETFDEYLQEESE